LSVRAFVDFLRSVSVQVWFVFGCGGVLVEWTAGFDIRGAKGKEDVLNPVSLMGGCDVMSGEYVISPIAPPLYRIGFYLI